MEIRSQPAPHSAGPELALSPTQCHDTSDWLWPCGLSSPSKRAVMASISARSTWLRPLPSDALRSPRCANFDGTAWEPPPVAAAGCSDLAADELRMCRVVELARRDPGISKPSV